MKNIHTYTLNQFISNVIERKNMHRYDKVVIDFSNMQLKTQDNTNTIKYITVFNDNTYEVVINGNGKFRFVSVFIDRFEREIGIIEWPTESDTISISLDCDELFY